jgi:hypothetical protein
LASGDALCKVSFIVDIFIASPILVLVNHSFPSRSHFVEFLLLLEFVVHDSVPGLNLLLVLYDVVLLTGCLPAKFVLFHHVELQLDCSSVFCFKAEPVDDVILAIFIQIAGSDQFFNFENPDRPTKEERVDLTVETAPGSPGLDFELVETGIGRDSSEPIPFDSVPLPVVY